MFKELKIDGLNKKYLIDEDGNIFDIKEDLKNGLSYSNIPKSII